MTGHEPLQLTRSVNGYASAFNFIQANPWHVSWAPWVLVICGGIVTFRYRRDLVLLSITVLPQIAAIVGYAFFLGALDHYYYLSLMPAAVLTVLLGATALPWPAVARIVAMALLAMSLAMAPARILYAGRLGKVPEYGALVDASRKMVRFGRPLHAIQTEFDLPPTSDREYIYRILGGRIERMSPWVGVIKSDGTVSYVKED